MAAVEAARARLRALEDQWDVARRPFEAQLEARQTATRKQREKAEEQLRCMQEWRTEIRELAASARAREQEQQRLMAEYEAAPKNVNAATFVRRITEIIKNIKKQEVEVVKIIADTREARRLCVLRAFERRACVPQAVNAQSPDCEPHRCNAR